LENGIDHSKVGLYNSVYICVTPNRGPGRRRQKLKRGTYSPGERVSNTHEYNPFL